MRPRDLGLHMGEELEEFTRLRSEAGGVQLLLDESHTPLHSSRLFIQASSATRQSKSLLGD